MSRASSPLKDRMIFLVGARRSGTNWLQRVVSAHPGVVSIPSETYLFSRGIAPLRERFHHGIQGSTGTGVMHMDEAEMLDALRDFCDRALLPYLQASPGAVRLAERTPEHVGYLDVIGAVYPDASIVHIVRDGRDVARSLLSQPWASAPKTMEEAAEEWRFSVASARSAARDLDHYVELRYEDLLSDPLGKVAELYGTLGLDAAAPLVEAAVVEAGIRYNVDPDAPQVTSGKWRESFSPADLEDFMRVAGPVLSELGYEPGPTSGAAEEAGESEAERGGPLRKLFGRKEREEEDEDPLERRVLDRAREIQPALDRVVSAIIRGEPGAVARLSSGSVTIRVLTPDEDWKGRGAAALERFDAVIARDAETAGRQVRGDLHIAVPTASGVMVFRSSGGRSSVRIVVATFNARNVATRIVYYNLPLAGA
jgi:sulfotransferase family protein